MRRKNTNKSQTNFYPGKKFFFLYPLLLSILAGGCGWENTNAAFRSAYFKTQRAVTNTFISIGKYQRDHAYGRQDTGETQTKTDKRPEAANSPTVHPSETPRSQDRFPSRTSAPVEEDLNSGESRKSAKAITRGEPSKEMPVPPRTTMTLQELRQRIREIERQRIRSRNPAERRKLTDELRQLERILLTSQKEENIIEEMTQLRRRLRKLQEDLLKIQKTSP